MLPQDPDPWNIISTHSLTRRLTPSTARCMNEYKNFNSQPHEEADVIDSLVGVSAPHFNSQPHEEADGRKCCASTMNTHFNSQPHEEADNSQSCTPFSCGSISTHSLTRRLTVLPCHLHLLPCDISTHSLTRRLTSLLDKECGKYGISTHSLTRRLTLKNKTFIISERISTHSLTRRLTECIYA